MTGVKSHMISFDGKKCVDPGIIRAADVPEKCFREDPLRMLRTLRLLSASGTQPEILTAAALHGCAHLLQNVPGESFFEELCGIVMGEHAVSILMGYPDVLAVRIPEIRPCIAFSQHSRFHSYTVWEHIARSVGAAPPLLPVRLTMLLHDIAKPACCRMDERGGHFTGHGEKSASAADRILRRLRCSDTLREQVCRLILHHRAVPGTREEAAALAGKLGWEEFCLYMDVIRADDLSKQEGRKQLSPRAERFLMLAEECADTAGKD